MAVSNINTCVGLGIMFSPNSPIDSAASYYFPQQQEYQPTTPQTTAPGTSSACSSRDFIAFTAHFAANLSSGIPLPRCQNIPSDLLSYVDQVLSTTQVSLSIVVLALGLMKRVQIKVLQLQGLRSPVSLTEGFASLGDIERNVLARLASCVSVKSLFVVSLMIAMKGPNGCCNTFTNLTWSQVAMIPSSLLSATEMDVALLLGFDLWSTEGQYVAWLTRVRAAAEEYSRRTGLQAQQRRVPIAPKVVVQASRMGPRSPVSPVNGHVAFAGNGKKVRRQAPKPARYMPYGRVAGTKIAIAMPESLNVPTSLMQRLPQGSFAHKVVGLMVPQHYQY
ncbi:hypothetical protein BC830DRAFT_1141225 [Chytriomyces sp. MP71]|nr:hypothetical protein BC830DRAFT_1141225 [Chytriomyces sp. MP71]